MAKISVVINTYNEEKKLSRALSSLKGFANEIVVVDMMSTDSTREIAKSYKARVFKHKKIGFVEPARNFAISKAKYDWVLILDADEVIPETLKTHLKSETKDTNASYFRIPRRNIIFGKWIKHTGWWPDYNIRFFKKGTVSWNEIIHSVPVTTGMGADLPARQEFAIKHTHYSSIEEYITRMNRYTTIQARELNKEGKMFNWTDIFRKPFAEFLTRYFAQEGYKDGLHGLSLSLLQAFSELTLYAKLWQKQKFKKRKISLEEAEEMFGETSSDLGWWFATARVDSAKNIFVQLWRRIIRKLKYQ